MRKPHWILKEHLCGQIEYVCSRCGAEFSEPWEECPECDVKIKKVKHDPVLVDEYEMMDIMLGVSEDDW